MLFAAVGLPKFLSSIRRLFTEKTKQLQRNTRHTGSRRRTALRLSLEQLEVRDVPSTISNPLIAPVNGQYFTWQDATPNDPNQVTIYYDFRSKNGFANLITPTEKALVQNALNMWTSATGGRLSFVQNSTAPEEQIINIGVGDMKAVGLTSGTGIVGWGGVEKAFVSPTGQPVLQQGFAWLDVTQPWNFTLGSGTPAGTIDFFTVMAHEIGHPLGLDDNVGVPGANIMNQVIVGQLLQPSALDVQQIQALYPPLPATAAPAPLSAAPTQLVQYTIVGADAGGGPAVRVFDGATEKFAFFAYDPMFTGGVRVAIGDVNGDGVSDIITAAGPGGGPDIHVYDGKSGTLVRQFFAYAPAFSSGVFVATGDVNGDGCADIICGADAGGGPNVTVFSGATGDRLQSFFAYDPRFTGGVRVAAGDVNGDGRADIICGAGAGGGPNVTVFSGADGSQLRSFFAYDQGFTAGLYVASGDINGDGRADLIAGAGAGGGPNVTAFDGATGALLQSFFAYDPSFTGGVRVGAARIGNGSSDRVLTAPGPGGSPIAQVYGLSATKLDSFFAYDAMFRGGVFIGGQN